MPAVSFATNSDCEPPLHLWLRDGADYARQLRGMYAIAIHERAQRTSTLTPRSVRHQAALHRAGCRTAWPSPPSRRRCWRPASCRARYAPSAREELLQLQFTTGTDTIFEGIQRLLPGETLTCSDGAHPGSPPHLPHPRRRAGNHRRGCGAGAAGPRADRKRRPAPAQRRALRHVPLRRHRQLHPPGADGAAEQRAGARLHRRLRCPRRRRRTRPGGNRGKAAGARSTRRSRSPRRWSGAICRRSSPRWTIPAADYAIIPTWFLARRARQDVKVVLSGEGGDEIFAGYAATARR